MRFVTWNIDGLNEAHLDERTEAAVFTAILGARIDQLHNGHKPSPPPEVIVFQEVVARTYHAHIRQHFPAGGYTVLPASAPERQTFEVIAYREPLTLRAYECIDLEDSVYGRKLHIIDFDCVAAGSEPLRVLTAHFDSGKDAAKVRRAQLRQVASMIGGHGVFGGDANLRKAEWEGERDTIGMSDAWEALGELSATRYTWQRDEYKARFDRVFIGSGLKAHSMGALGVDKLPGLNVPISDHIGLAVEFSRS